MEEVCHPRTTVENMVGLTGGNSSEWKENRKGGSGKKDSTLNKVGA